MASISLLLNVFLNSDALELNVSNEQKQLKDHLKAKWRMRPVLVTLALSFSTNKEQSSFSLMQINDCHYLLLSLQKLQK